MPINIALGAVLSGIAALIAVGIGGPMIGLIVFVALFLMVSTGGLAFISTLDLPTGLIILVVFVIIFVVMRGKKK